MARFFVYLILILGLMLMFNLVGLATTTGAFLGQIGVTSPETLVNIQDTPIYSRITLALGLFATAGIIIGTLTRGTHETAVSAGIATAVLFVFISDLISIVTYANQVATDPFSRTVGYFVFILMTPLIAGYIFSLYDWVRKHD